MLLGDDVIRLMWERGIVFAQQAILTTSARPMPYLLTHMFGNPLPRTHLLQCARLELTMRRDFHLLK